MPAVSVVGLYNPTGSFTLGQGHTDGVELNGILGHRFNYSLGWVASSAASGLKAPDAEDAYVHIGLKSGGVALDGEGRYGPNVPDPKKPWAEKSITFDAFAYHGMSVLDNGTGVATATGAATPLPQRDGFNAIGGSIRGQYDSLVITTGGQLEAHQKPYQGSAATPAAAGPPPTPATPGNPDFTSSTAVLGYGEIDYVIFPWLVPGVRAEYTRMTVESSNPASLLRVIPGVALLARPNIKVVITGDIERAYGMPVTGSWGPAGGNIVAPGPGVMSKFEAEQINAGVFLAF